MTTCLLNLLILSPVLPLPDLLPLSGAASLTKITLRTEPHVIKVHSGFNIFQSRVSPENSTHINLLLIYLPTTQANATSVLLCTIVSQLQQKQPRSPLCRQMVSVYISNSIEVMRN